MESMVQPLSFHSLLFLSVLQLSGDQCASPSFSSPTGQQNTETSGREVQGEDAPKKLPLLDFSYKSEGLEKDAFRKDENAEDGLHG